MLILLLQILEGKDLLNERTNTEFRYLKKACSLSLSHWHTQGTLCSCHDSILTGLIQVELNNNGMDDITDSQSRFS